MQVVGQLVFVQNRRIGKTERTGFHTDLYIVRLVGFEDGAAGAQVQRACRTVVFGRLQQFTLLTVVKADFLQVIHRELAQIDRPVLGIADFYPVVENA